MPLLKEPNPPKAGVAKQRSRFDSFTKRIRFVQRKRKQSKAWKDAKKGMSNYFSDIAEEIKDGLTS